ncbi:MAG: hypothetical protein EAX87_02120 [Candidatus Thorarchaeota archaeon]|nr:hypothetical protein [Candidatus Thorarchaeota archaeon]
MEIPFLTNFIEGLKLFFSSKRLKWFTLVFIIGAFLITIYERITVAFPALQLLTLFAGGIFPTFFMVAAFLSLLGLTRLVADEESYRRSLISTLTWLVISIVILILLLLVRTFFNVLFIGIGFLGWIGFQSYFAARNSLGYAEGVKIEQKSKLAGVLYGVIYVANYVVIVGAFLVSTVLFGPALLWIIVAFLGTLLAAGFNFFNGLILAKERDKSTGPNIAFLGFFVSFYSAYFIYNVLKGFDPSLDLVSIAISVLFILYTMSGIGSTLSSRAELDTRWKLSKELAATTTFFLASGYMFVDAMFSVILSSFGDPALAGAAGDAIKLFIFPFVALFMELNFIRKSRKVSKEPEVPEEQPVESEEEPAVEEEPEEVSEPVEDEEASGVPEDEVEEETTEDSELPDEESEEEE